MMSAVMKPESGAVVAAEDLARYAGVGTEGADANDYAVPFLHILQKLSPQCDRQAPEFNPDAREGMILETTSSAVYDGDKGIIVIPCAFRKDLVEWKQRNSGGGFVAAHGWNEAMIGQTTKNDKGQNVLPNGNLLVETKYHYVLMLADDGPRAAVISMTSTQLKKSRKWMSLMQLRKMKTADGKSFIPPTFAFIYHLKTIYESNDKGNWYSWDIEPGPPVSDARLIREAIKFHKAVGTGEVKIVDSSPALADDDDIPF